MDIIRQSNMRTALVHHWLVAQRGGEGVLAALAELFPSADLFTLVYERSQLPSGIARRRLHSSFLQKFPRPAHWYPYYLPLFPLATEHLDLSGYDLVISSDAVTMKGVRVDAHATHICYCHTPMRYVWSGYETYTHAAGPLARLALQMTRNPLRTWDYRAAQGVTQFVANSLNVRDRIQQYYARQSVVIYPPVDTDQFVVPAFQQFAGNFFLLVSQLVPYKRVDLVVEAFNWFGMPLVIIGDGPERARLERQADPNIRFLGFQPRQTLVDYMQRCQAFVFAGEEDFGIVMAEAQACGKPVVALGKGGAREIIENGSTGILFEEQSVDSLLDGLERFRQTSFDASTLRASALRFRRERFLFEFSELVNERAVTQAR